MAPKLKKTDLKKGLKKEPTIFKKWHCQRCLHPEDMRPGTQEELTQLSATSQRRLQCELCEQYVRVPFQLYPQPLQTTRTLPQSCAGAYIV